MRTSLRVVPGLALLASPILSAQADKPIAIKAATVLDGTGPGSSQHDRRGAGVEDHDAQEPEDRPRHRRDSGCARARPPRDDRARARRPTGPAGRARVGDLPVGRDDEDTALHRRDRARLEADIIAIDGNPLQDINAVRRVLFVMESGMVFENLARGPKGAGGTTMPTSGQ
jgi:hypothetical protein